VPVRRPDDLLVFELALRNLRLATDPPPRLVREKENAPATLIVILPPQSFGEEALLEATPELKADIEGPPPVGEGKIAAPDKHDRDSHGVRAGACWIQLVHLATRGAPDHLGRRSYRRILELSGVGPRSPARRRRPHEHRPQQRRFPRPLSRKLFTEPGQRGYPAAEGDR
jgi:hypothetical protein